LGGELEDAQRIIGLSCFEAAFRGLEECNLALEILLLASRVARLRPESGLEAIALGKALAKLALGRREEALSTLDVVCVERCSKRELGRWL